MSFSTRDHSELMSEWTFFTRVEEWGVFLRFSKKTVVHFHSIVFSSGRFHSSVFQSQKSKCPTDIHCEWSLICDVISTHSAASCNLSAREYLVWKHQAPRAEEGRGRGVHTDCPPQRKIQRKTLCGFDCAFKFWLCIQDLRWGPGRGTLLRASCGNSSHQCDSLCMCSVPFCSVLANDFGGECSEAIDDQVPGFLLTAASGSYLQYLGLAFGGQGVVQQSSLLTVACVHPLPHIL